MGGEHRGHAKSTEGLEDIGWIDTAVEERTHCRGDTAGTVGLSGVEVLATSMLEVEILSGVGEQGQPPEGSDDVQDVVDFRPVEDGAEIGDRGVPLASRLHRSAPYPFDEIEHGLAGLLGDHLAENSAKEADVVS